MRVGAAVVALLLGGAADPEKIDYSRDIRPLLSNHCFQCHGPGGKPKGGLRLDLREDALRELKSGARALVPGNPAKSELVRRILSADPDEQMPPAETRKPLKAAEKELLKRWIAEGAEYGAHWAFVPPRRVEPPAVKNAAWPRNPVDRFILARLEREGLAPSPEADKVTLLRRATLDLTGLPPTPAEVDAFLADPSRDAYEKQIDRLLASPAYGERMATQWLDAARYADTNGYQVDSVRTMWPWRDWVIRAFNENLPFDRFTTEQLAGDLLPGATVQQQVATGFNRNHRINEEGGAIDAEFRVEYVVDRVETTATVWLALTLGCARCHDHKYDPVSQKEFYRFFAFFNNLPEAGVAGGNPDPVVKVPTAEQQKKLDELAAEIQGHEARMTAANPEVDAAQAAWEKSLAERGVDKWEVLLPLAPKSKGGATLQVLDDKSVLASGTNPETETYTLEAETPLKSVTAIRLEALPHESLPAQGPGRAGNGNIVLSEIHVAAGTAKPKIKAAQADHSQQDYGVDGSFDGKPKTGWALHPHFGKPHEATFELSAPLQGDALRLTVTLDFQHGSQHQLGRFRLAATDAKNPLGVQGIPGAIRAILKVAPEARSEKQKADLRSHYRSAVSPALKAVSDRLAALRKERSDLEKSVPAGMVMRDMAKPRDTFVLKRGLYDQPGEKVTAGVPAALPPLPEGAAADRLGLAKWLLDPSHPLTSRVAVNRFWQMLFGTGLVRTIENLGSQAEWPSHPELFDWLATEFIRTKWDMKALLKLVMTSATYRQSSRVTPALLAKDPENRLLARAPRLRLPAEFLRDQALAASGLLARKIGGPSVKPYQPAGLWEEMAYGPGVNVYTPDKGESLFRRSMYTFWRRTVPPPGMTTFDAPSREVCTVNRSRTNTPLQALALLNEPIYVEASRHLAQRALKEAGPTPEERLTHLFRLVLARKPSPAELKVLRGGVDRHLAEFASKPDAAKKLIGVGESARDEKLDPAQLAAYAAQAAVLLNLDEAVTRE